MAVVCPVCKAKMNESEVLQLKYCTKCGIEIPNDLLQYVQDPALAEEKVLTENNLIRLEQVRRATMEYKNSRALRWVCLISWLLISAGATVMGILSVDDWPRFGSTTLWMIFALCAWVLGLSIRISASSSERNQVKIMMKDINKREAVLQKLAEEQALIEQGYLRFPDVAGIVNKVQYTELLRAIEFVGFTNVTCEGKKSSGLSISKNKDGLGDFITVCGETNYTGGLYKPDAPVVIHYHGEPKEKIKSAF